MTTARSAVSPIALRVSCLLVLASSAVAGKEKLGIQPETEISWTPVAGNSYQLQRSPAGEGEAWTDFGPAHAGLGASQKAYDSAGAGRRLYRVMETVPASGETLILSNAIAGANPGFESGTNHWILGATHSIVSSNARSGTSALRSHISQSGFGAQLVKNVPAVVPGKAYSLSFWAKQISADPTYGVLVFAHKVEWSADDGR